MQIQFAANGKDWIGSDLILRVNEINYGLRWQPGFSKVLCRKIGLAKNRRIWWWKNDPQLIELPLRYGWDAEQLGKYLVLL